MTISEPLVHREKRMVALVITTDDYKVVDLDMCEADAREMHQKLEIALAQFNN